MTHKRDEVRSILQAAIKAAQPAQFLPRHLPPAPRGRLIILAAGKAGASMAAAAEAHYIDSLGLAPERISGSAVCRYGYATTTRRVAVIEAGHPIPDEAGVRAASQALELASAAQADDLVLVLLSGGGSANWVAPACAVSLADKQALTRALQRAGAHIGELNCVRKHLSRFKGGRLAVATHPAPLVTIAISDVPGDNPSVIASGPTVGDDSTLADAQAVLARFGIVPSPAIARALADPANESPKPGDERLGGERVIIACRPRDGLEAACREADRLGYPVISLGVDVEGEAREVAGAHAAMARRLAAQGQRAAILSGGELTVTVKGKGRGGPNQEYVLALALALDGNAAIHALAADTDGTDGGSGAPDDAAGAMAFPDTLRRAREQAIDPAAFLANNDATTCFERLGDLVMTGPTLTNVNDLRVILVDP
ncbi:MAG: glycerate kinase [Hyphomicrobiales bacterium]|nr:glycerate kinase [Hyphomicrobiales bacterium]OQW83058.1 MAG: glycerate kinase [Proteobacteria bacterium ST_bin15]